MINKKIKRKKCSKCKLIYPATAEYFYRNKGAKDNLLNQCKDCRNKQKKMYRREKQRKLEEERDRLVIKRFKQALNRKDDPRGLNLSDLKLDKNKTYKVKLKPSKYNHSKEFIGKLIQNEDRFITLQKENGLIESFLKADLLRHKNIKEVN